jgi:cytochrome c
MQAKMIPAAALALAALVSTYSARAAQLDSSAGRIAFEKRCTGCHALDHDKEGPRLGGVIGRKAGTVAGFPYSDAVKGSSMVWSEDLLDKWLTDPETVIPATDMAFRLDNAGERAAIIAFLKTAK